MKLEVRSMRIHGESIPQPNCLTLSELNLWCSLMFISNILYQLTTYK
jgi:hypothetical protein